MMEVVMILDITKHYSYHDKNEVKWTFTYQNVTSDAGWYAWLIRPGQTEICIGRITEEEIVEKLEQNPPLTQDDLIDLELWLERGGLSSYNPRKQDG